MNTNNTQAPQLPQTAVSSSYDWLKDVKTAWTYGAILTPVEVEVLSVDFENKLVRVKTETQEGNLPFDRIWKTSVECDFL
jgi:hypothetical protein